MRNTDGIEVTEIDLDRPLTGMELAQVRIHLMVALRRYNELRSAPVRNAHHMMLLCEAESSVERLQTIIAQHERFTIN